MESQNQTVKEYYARRFLLPTIVIGVIGIILLLALPVKSVSSIIMITCSLLMFVFQYMSVYITIGEDFITLRPTPMKEENKVFFKNIKSIQYEKKYISIAYYNETSKTEENLKIPFNRLDDNTKTELLNNLHTCLKDKETLTN
ncbi:MULTISPECIES: hypothetical protein [Gilliamella]|uniref:hypothetical protein n=1 Tax=Gilliamella TaxID=1193503 RepID=UPI0018DE8F74|nr:MULTISPECIES: hypothetical protein [unclassified Gilliamella]MBI0030687.1 hypothetical protein [Gilliamella sp. B14384G15]MBI0057983.1 hypothetical protein [Gilliamella sp. B14384G12]